MSWPSISWEDGVRHSEFAAGLAALATAVNERRVALGNNSPIDFNVNTDESGNTVTKQYPVESDLYGLPIRGYERDWPDYIGCEKLFDAIAGAAVALKNIDVNLVPLDNKLQRDPWDGIDALAANHDIDYTDSDSLNIYNADAWRFLKELLDYWVYVRLKPDIDLVSYKWRNGSRDNNAQTAWAYNAGESYSTLTAGTAVIHWQALGNYYTGGYSVSDTPEISYSIDLSDYSGDLLLSSVFSWTYENHDSGVSWSLNCFDDVVGAGEDWTVEAWMIGSNNNFTLYLDTAYPATIPFSGLPDLSSSNPYEEAADVAVFEDIYIYIDISGELTDQAEE